MKEMFVHKIPKEIMALGKAFVDSDFFKGENIEKEFEEFLKTVKGSE